METRCPACHGWPSLRGQESSEHEACDCEASPHPQRAEVDRLLGMLALVRVVAEFGDLGRDELNSREERAYERSLEEFYGASGPQTDRERSEVLARGGVR